MREETLRQIKDILGDIRKNTLPNNHYDIDIISSGDNSLLDEKTYLDILKKFYISKTTFEKYVNVNHLLIKEEADIQRVIEVANYFLRKESSSVYYTPYSNMLEFCYENGKAYEYKDIVLIGDIKE